MIRDTTDPNTEDLGGPLWQRVRLIGTLTKNGKADGWLIVPKTPPDPTDPDLTDEDWWQTTETKVRNIRNGLPNDDGIGAGKAVWIYNYFGRWVVMIPEC